jgi:sulfite reductase (NADPH) flavoprotein alpha-component
METVYNRKNPFPATLEVNKQLTAEGSNKDTRHFELALANSGLNYEVGDSLGVFPSNDPILVDTILHTMGLTGEEEVPLPDKTTDPLRQALLKNYIITEPSKQLLAAVAERDASAAYIATLLEPDAKGSLEHFLWGRDVLDVLEEFPGARFDATEFAGLLRKLQPRLYSIASSQKAVGESVHLTVAVVRYTPDGRPRQRSGVCSSFLAERAAEPGSVPVFVHTAKHFRIPEDPATACIMVGPGTGIAPFRAFLQERAAIGATGKNWLFFGEQHSATDFFYRDEFEAAQAAGILTRMDTAFSRDQDHKIYVQHRLLENADEIWKWLQDGAIFYVCGDAQRMAKDVDLALHQIAEKAGGLTPDGANEFVDGLKKAKRYRKDVY